MLSLILLLQSFLSSLLVYLYPLALPKSVTRILNTHITIHNRRIHSLVHRLYATTFLTLPGFSSWKSSALLNSVILLLSYWLAVSIHISTEWTKKKKKKKNGDCIWRENCSSCASIPQRAIPERYSLCPQCTWGFWLMCFSNMIPLHIIIHELLCVTWDTLQLKRGLQLTLEHCWQRTVTTAF